MARSEKVLDNRVCRSMENLFDALKLKGVVIKSIEVNKALELYGEQVDKITLDFGIHFNRRHIKVNVNQHRGKK